MKIGSLFSGIGGLDLGIERATGGDVVWQCEANPYCRSILARHWPGVPCFPDVVGLDPPPCELLIGGFPCQDISSAGKREGISGHKSGLWTEYARIIRLLRPRLVFVENVRALTVRGLDVVLGDLASCGYDAEWTVLGACCVGAPHRRERLFLLAYLQGGAPGPIRSVANSHGGRLAIGAGVRPGESLTVESGKGQVAGHWGSEPCVGRVAHGVPGRVAQLQALGNSVVPAQAEMAFRILQERLP